MKYWLLLFISTLALVNSSTAFAGRGGRVGKEVLARKNRNAAFSSLSLFENSKRNNHVGLNHKQVLAKNGISRILNTKPEEFEVAVPLNDSRTVTLSLYKIKNDFKIRTSRGTLLNSDDSILSYRGVIKGKETDSLVSITISPNEISGNIEDGSDQYAIEKIRSQDANAGDENLAPHMIYKPKDVERKSSDAFQCGNTPSATVSDSETMSGMVELPEVLGAPALVANKSVKWLWEVRYEIFQGKGNLANTTAYVQGVFNQVAALYADIGVAFELKTLYIWETQDPYAGPSTGDFLSQFGNLRTDFLGADHAFLLGYTGGGGVAWLSGICSNQKSIRQGYCGIRSTYSAYPAYSWTVECVAHEQGHIMGSSHTHDCKWNGNNTAIDGCGPAAGYAGSGSCSMGPIPDTNKGTIMSYCHLSPNKGISLDPAIAGFGPQPTTLIQNKVIAASCLSAPTGTPPPVDSTAPTVSLTAPASGANLSATVSMTATAADNTGVARVEFYRDSTVLLGTSTVTPYSYSLNTTTLTNGSHTFAAKAYDAAGNVGSSTTITATVSNVVCTAANPSVTLSPVSQSANRGMSSSYSAAVKNNDSAGCATRAFALSSVLPTGFTALISPTSLSLAPSQSGPATISVTAGATVSVGSYSIGLKATAGSNNATGNATNIVTIPAPSPSPSPTPSPSASPSPAPSPSPSPRPSASPSPTPSPSPSPVIDTQSPMVSITSPVSGVSFSAWSFVSVKALATDNGGVDRVEIFVDGKRLCTDRTAPYSCYYMTFVRGRTYNFSAKAFDAAGNQATSVIISAPSR